MAVHFTRAFGRNTPSSINARCASVLPAFIRQARMFHLVPRSCHVKPFLLADIGEGITECQLIQWFVQPGARVEQFDKLCEVQSDKASVEITSPFDGVIKKLHYEPDDMAITGKPLVDIDIQSEIGEAEEGDLGSRPAKSGIVEDTDHDDAEVEVAREETTAAQHDIESESFDTTGRQQSQHNRSSIDRRNMGALSTPAVRHLTKELNVKIEEVVGTGKDGRVLKEDVHRHVNKQTSGAPESSSRSSRIEDRRVPLTPVQNQMFKAMTRSLNIPHFLYSCSAEMTEITRLRKKLNDSRDTDRITSLAFILKAVSMAFREHAKLNASLEYSDIKRPVLKFPASHDFGVAVDTPSGLLVPIIHAIQELSINDIAGQLRVISEKARAGKLVPADLSGATFTISNIGSVGGGVVSPVITEPQVAILGIGRSKIVPAFDQHGELVKREELVLSWSADHRVVDGAECAKCAEKVRGFLEEPGAMLVEM